MGWLLLMLVPAAVRSVLAVIAPLLSMLPVMDRPPPVPVLATMTPLLLLVSVPLIARDSLYPASIDSIRIVPLLVTFPIANFALPKVLLPCTQTVADVERLFSSVD